MMNTQEALKMAIDKLENHLGDLTIFLISNPQDKLIKKEKEQTIEVIQACKEALAQPAQEPYGWELFFNNGQHNRFTTNKSEATEYGENKIALYTHPAPSWQGLSDDEIGWLLAEGNGNYWDFARAIEQALKEKNS
jgi:hypothetical protein